MGDNVLVTPGVGASIAADDVSSVYYQKIKLDAGGDGVSSPVASGNGLPIAYAAAADFLSGTTAAITDTTRTPIIAAQAAGVKIYVTTVVVTNSGSVGTFVKIEDGTTTLFQAYADAYGGGFVVHFPVPLVTTAATALNASCVTTGANVVANAVGYKGA